MTTLSPPRAILPTHRVLSACLAGGEPRLEEILAELIVQFRMNAVGATAQEMRALSERVREKRVGARQA